MTAPDPSKTERPASPACVVRVQQRGESEAHSLPQEEPSLDLVRLSPVAMYGQSHPS